MIKRTTYSVIIPARLKVKQLRIEFYIPKKINITKLKTEKEPTLINCPRCGKECTCDAGNIGMCDCNQVIISKPEYEYISSKFKDCVCNNCLEELKNEYYYLNRTRIA